MQRKNSRRVRLSLENGSLAIEKYFENCFVAFFVVVHFTVLYHYAKCLLLSEPFTSQFAPSPTAAPPSTFESSATVLPRETEYRPFFKLVNEAAKYSIIFLLYSLLECFYALTTLYIYYKCIKFNGAI